MRKTDRLWFNYTTFPNSNLCLAIYKQNAIQYAKEKNTNNCLVGTGGRAIASRMYGFHTMPFKVDIQGEIDQVCILFHPAGLRAFSNIPYDELLRADMPFEELFGTMARTKLERMFDQSNVVKRAGLLEALLAANLKTKVDQKINEALHFTTQFPYGQLDITGLCQKLSLSESSLFRLFVAQLGQNPKAYIKTLRFRKALDDVLGTPDSLTSIAYQNSYYDQAHFINDFKSFTGFTPGKLKQQISVQQHDFAWVFQKKTD